MRIVWGFFLKLMIADKAAVVVNEVFGNWEAYRGGYVLVAGGLYSIQLYADFLSCVCLARGTAELFGIRLPENFRSPYRAESVKEFWGRWHISLSSWLRDYIYIPLGGNRKGRLRKWLHIFVVFTVSGIWHGAGYKYLFWGWMHGAYQVCGELTGSLQNRLFQVLGFPESGRGRGWLRRAGTWFWVMVAWIIFRAESLRQGLRMKKDSM
ncbi:MAG: MBOAT family protein, partial [Lachnospiraceae bacterium]|nr:MBOAT family protein [Lachnospiraceae bacterium]